MYKRQVQFLRGKGDEDGSAAGGQSPLNLDLAIRQRQAAHQALFLLEIKAAQIAVVLLGDGACLKDVIFQFLFCAPGVQHLSLIHILRCTGKLTSMRMKTSVCRR